MKISVITLFPEVVGALTNYSIVKRAYAKKLVDIQIINLRDYAKDKYGTVDDRPYGGGVGMILKSDIVWAAFNKLKVKSETFKVKKILTSPKGKVYDQKKAREYSKLDHLIIISGHYEGIDERVSTFIDEEISIGDFVLTGGELPTAVIIDSVVRLIPGVLKKEAATKLESFYEVSIDELIAAIGQEEHLTALKNKGQKTVKLLEYPQFTRPEIFKSIKVPEVLLSGDHAKIEKWRLKTAFEETLKKRPDMLV